MSDRSYWTVAPRLRHVARLRLSTMMRRRVGSGAVARLAVGAIRVDVAPCAPAPATRRRPGSSRSCRASSLEALSGRLTSKGATLTVRIDSLTIGPNKDSRAWDNISGVATLGGVERPVRATSRYWASAIDPATIVQSNHARVSAATQALAFWIARDL